LLAERGAVSQRREPHAHSPCLRGEPECRRSSPTGALAFTFCPARPAPEACGGLIGRPTGAVPRRQGRIPVIHRVWTTSHRRVRCCALTVALAATATGRASAQTQIRVTPENARVSAYLH